MCCWSQLFPNIHDTVFMEKHLKLYSVAFDFLFKSLLSYFKLIKLISPQLDNTHLKYSIFCSQWSPIMKKHLVRPFTLIPPSPSIKFPLPSALLFFFSLRIAPFLLLPKAHWNMCSFICWNKSIELKERQLSLLVSSFFSSFGFLSQSLIGYLCMCVL